MLSGLIAGGCPTALYFLDDSPVKNMWLIGTGGFLFGTIYTFSFIIPDVKVMLDEENINKKGRRIMLRSRSYNARETTS